MAKQNDITLTKEVFRVLFEAIEKQYQRDWLTAVEKNNIINEEMPTSSNEILKFFGYKDGYDGDNSLRWFIQQNDAIQKYWGKEQSQKLSTRKLYDMWRCWNKFRDGKVNINKESLRLKGRPYIHIYFKYIGYNDLDAFLDKHEVFSTDAGQKIRNAQIETLHLENYSDELQEITYLAYSFVQPTHEVFMDKLSIKYDCRSYENMAATFEIFDWQFQGIANYKGEILEIRFERETAKNSWNPISLYFTVHKDRLIKIHELNVLHGIYSGVSLLTTKTIARDIVLIRSEIANEETVRDAHRLLFFNQMKIKIEINRDHQISNNIKRLLYPPEDNLGLLRKMIGDFELYSIDPKGKIYVYKIIIQDTFSCIIYSATESKYIGKLSIVSPQTFIIYIDKNKSCR